MILLDRLEVFIISVSSLFCWRRMCNRNTYVGGDGEVGIPM